MSNYIDPTTYTARTNFQCPLRHCKYFLKFMYHNRIYINKIIKPSIVSRLRKLTKVYINT